MTILALLIPLGMAIYTVNYARWAWRQKLRLGAIGLYLLAVMSVVVPAMVLMYNQ